MKFIIFIFAIMNFLSCVSVRSEDSISVENTVIITGRVVVYGNEPRTYAAIVDTDGVRYAIYPRSRENELRQLQGHLIEFTVIFVDNPSPGNLSLMGEAVTPISWEIIR